MTISESKARAAAQEATKHLVDDGKLVAAGWLAFRLLAIPKDTPEDEIARLRFAFMAGAEHVFSSVVSMLDEGLEPTDTDLRRMDSIHEEIEEIRREMELRFGRARGTG